MFGRKKKNPGDEGGDPRIAAMHRAIEERRGVDPLVGAKIGGKAVVDHLLTRLSDERGVQIELIATAIGVLAGRACFIATVVGTREGLDGYAGKSMMNVGAADGSEYLMGDAINWPLLASPQSVWALVAGMLQHVGAVFPTPEELVSANTAAIGTAAYGVPGYADGAGISVTPRELLALWDAAQFSVTQGAVHPVDWPIAYGIAGQHLVELSVGQADPAMVGRIILESAVGMAKLIVPIQPSELAVAGR